MFSILMSAIVAGTAGPALAQACTREGDAVSCDDGRRGLPSDDAIIWPDGTRSSLPPHPSIIIGNKPSVRAGPGVFAGQGKGVVPLDDPSALNKTRWARHARLWHFSTRPCPFTEAQRMPSFVAYCISCF